MSAQVERVIFGAPPPGAACQTRRAAYAVILDTSGRVAVVGANGHWFLPGGGCFDGESFESAALREIQEECGREARLLEPLGEALQYFRDSERWYEMTARFFRAEFLGGQNEPAEHEMDWLDPARTAGLFHDCHTWAIARAHSRSSQERLTA